jgi:hypothetical protein
LQFVQRLIAQRANTTMVIDIDSLFWIKVFIGLKIKVKNVVTIYC